MSHNKGTCRGDGKGVGRGCVASKAIGRHEGEAPVLDGVPTTFHIGTAKRFSVQCARSIQCRLKRHVRMPVPKTSRSTSTSIKSRSGRMERRDDN